MFAGKSSFLRVSMLCTGVFIVLLVLSMPTATSADDNPPPNHGKCITCHDDLYYLHDTGKWYCLKESPMTCVGCHGGNPNTTSKELAHTNRSPHPVINEDVSKCQQCHPAECAERVEQFDQLAGISEVKVALPYAPAASNASEAPQSLQTPPDSNNWLSFMEILPILLVGGMGMIFYIIRRLKHAQANRL